jgi:hypothetical protein
MPALLAVIQDGTDEGRAAAQAELTRLAKIVDAQNAEAKTGLETMNGHTVEAFAVYSPGRPGAITYSLTKDQAGLAAVYAHEGEVTAARAANHGTKCREDDARRLFDFANDYRR